jgi:integrase
MVVRVRLEGLKIARNPRGRYYVYIRATGEPILRNFAGTREDLLHRLAEPDMLGLYNARRPRAARAYPEYTLGWLVAWFLDPERPEFRELSKTTQDEYRDRLGWLELEYDAPLRTITQAALYAVRDKCAADKWPAYADKMMTALSSMFEAAVKRQKIPNNPAKGIERVYKPNRNANREWRPEEWTVVMERARPHLKTAYMIARYAGYRSQSIVRISWTDYQDDPTFGKCFRLTHRKNDEQHWVPVELELQAYLAALKIRTPDGPIALRHNGKPWESAEQLQKQSSNFLTALARKGLVGPGLTEHGLRATFAAARKREVGANDSQVAAALGDRDTRMGAHYTRHVENEIKVIQAFGKVPPKTKK